MGEIFDLVVIGAGPGGYEAAIEGAAKGMKTALVENRELGGTCLNRGCIPTKTILHTADLYRELKTAEQIGLKIEAAGIDMAAVQRRKTEVLEQLRNGIGTLMKKNKITVINGTGTIMDRNHVRVRGKTEEHLLETRYILIASGSVPAGIPIPGAQLPGVVTSDELLDKTDTFEHLLIIGGGVIGMEFASIYSSLGHKVTVIEALDRILANMDREISQNLKMILKKRNVDILTGTRVEEILPAEGGGLVCRYTAGEKQGEEKAGEGKAGEIKADGILVAVGRKACMKDLAAPESQQEIREIAVEKGCIVTDEYGRTSVPGVYAVGDVTGGIQLAHRASAQGRNAVCHMLGERPVCDENIIPSCVYTSPEIGCVGITADQAKEQGIRVITRKYLMGANGKSVLSLQERGFIKVVAEADSHRILGAQMMCGRATDMISQFGTAIVNGLTMEEIARTVFPHPTFSEGIGEAVRQ